LRFGEPYDAIEALDSLPLDMEDAYLNILDRVEPTKRATVIRVLSWLYYARRPLHKDELREAIAVRPGQVTLPKHLMHLDTLIQCCLGLITTDEDSGVVRFTHFTVQEFLAKRYEAKLLSTVDLARVCLTYLAFDIFESGPCSSKDLFERNMCEYRFSNHAVLFWGDYTRGMGESDDIALEALRRILRSPEKRGAIYQILLTSTHWGDFCWEFSVSDFKTCLPIHLIAAAGLLGLCEPPPHTDSLDDFSIPHKLGLRLEFGNTTSRDNCFGYTALILAARQGYLDIVERLLDTQAESEVRDSEGWTVLHHAARMGHKSVVCALLDHGEDINAQDDNGVTALNLATRWGHSEVVSALLHHGTEMNVLDRNHSTAACHATGRECEKQRLNSLEHSGYIDIDARDHEGYTALSEAARNGHKQIVCALLDHGAEVNAEAENGLTALHRAARNGYTNIVRELLERGADFDVRDEDGWSALHFAAWHGHAEVFNELCRWTYTVNGKVLGTQSVRGGLQNDTVENFEALLRVWLTDNPDDFVMWRAEGNEYLRRGMYVAAANAFDASVNAQRGDSDVTEVRFLRIYCDDCNGEITGYHYKCKRCHWNYDCCGTCLSERGHAHNRTEMIMIPSQMMGEPGYKMLGECT
jgi:ankyrin repeat domain-containing protein 50